VVARRGLAAAALAVEHRDRDRPGHWRSPSRRFPRETRAARRGDRPENGIGTFPGKLDGPGPVSRGNPTGAGGRAGRERRTRFPTGFPGKDEPNSRPISPGKPVPGPAPNEPKPWPEFATVEPEFPP